MLLCSHFAWASLELFTGLSWFSLGRGCYHSFCWEVATILELSWSSSNFHWGVFCFGTSHPRFIYNNMILWSMSVFTGFLCWRNYLYSQHLKMPQTLQDSGFFVFPGLNWHVPSFSLSSCVVISWLGTRTVSSASPCIWWSASLGTKQYPLVTSLYLWLPTKYCNLWKQISWWHLTHSGYLTWWQ